MAITTYAELQAAVADWLNRQDLTATIPNFISLAEAQLNRELRHRKMITRATLTVDAQYENQPADFLETVRFQLNTNPITPLVYETPEQILEDSQTYVTSGQPMFFSTIGTQFQFLPVPDASYSAELMYYAQIPSLSVSNTSNWLLTEAPDVYLYATLIQSAPYLKEDERIGTWAGIYQRLLADLKVSDERARIGSSKLVARIRSFG